MEQQMMNRWWRIAGGLSMNLALGAVYAWSIFVAPLEKEFGWSRADTSMVFTILVFMFGSTFILAGRLQDKLGPFKISVIGALANSLGFFMCAYTTSMGWMFFWLGVVAATGQGFGYSTPIPVMAKWFPDRRGLAVGLAVAGYGGGSAIFGPLGGNWLIPTYGWRTTFMVFGIIFFIMGMAAAFVLKNPPAGYKPAGWTPAPAAKAAATAYDFTPGEVLKTPAFYWMWIAYALGTSAGLMVISQLVPFAKSQGIPSTAVATMGIVVGAIGSASGRIFSGWMSDGLGRLNVLRLMTAVSALSMPILYAAGNNVAMLYALVFAIYWCYGTMLSVNASTASDFWGTKNAGVNYGLLFTAWGVAGIIGPRIGGKMFVAYKNYQVAFWTGGILCAIALLCLLMAKRPAIPQQAQEARAKA